MSTTLSIVPRLDQYRLRVYKERREGSVLLSTTTLLKRLHPGLKGSAADRTLYAGEYPMTIPKNNQTEFWTYNIDPTWEIPTRVKSISDTKTTYREVGLFFGSVPANEPFAVRAKYRGNYPITLTNIVPYAPPPKTQMYSRQYLLELPPGHYVFRIKTTKATWVEDHWVTDSVKRTLKTLDWGPYTGNSTLAERERAASQYPLVVINSGKMVQYELDETYDVRMLVTKTCLQSGWVVSSKELIKGDLSTSPSFLEQVHHAFNYPLTVQIAGSEPLTEGLDCGFGTLWDDTHNQPRYWYHVYTGIWYAQNVQTGTRSLNSTLLAPNEVLAECMPIQLSAAEAAAFDQRIQLAPSGHDLPDGAFVGVALSRMPNKAEPSGNWARLAAMTVTPTPRSFGYTVPDTFPPGTHVPNPTYTSIPVVWAVVRRSYYNADCAMNSHYDHLAVKQIKMLYAGERPWYDTLLGLSDDRDWVSYYPHTGSGIYQDVIIEMSAVGDTLDLLLAGTGQADMAAVHVEGVDYAWGAHWDAINDQPQMAYILEKTYWDDAACTIRAATPTINPNPDRGLLETGFWSYTGLPPVTGPYGPTAGVSYGRFAGPALCLSELVAANS